MYKQHADKILDLLKGSDETIEQAFVLLDALVDTLPDDGRVAFQKVFQGLSFEHGTFAWMQHHLNQMSSWQHYRFHEKGYFWRFVDLYLRTHPDYVSALPSVLHLKYIIEIPWFLKNPNPCRAILLDNTSKSVTGLERCLTVASVHFNLSEWDWNSVSLSFDLNAIRNRTEDFAISAPGFMAKWEMHDGVCELVILKENNEYNGHLTAFTNQVTLQKHPRLHFSNVPNTRLTQDLWSATTPYSALEFANLKLVLSEDVQASIAERVEEMIISSGSVHNTFDTMFNASTGAISFPNLKVVSVENKGVLSLHINAGVLRTLPALERVSVQGGESNVTWDPEVWEMEHPLLALTADEFDAFYHHWEFSEGTGTLRERLCKMSVTFDWIKQHTQLLKGVTHLNIFQSDVSWPFVRDLVNIEELYVEGGQCDGEFDYHSVSIPSSYFFEPSQITTETESKGIKTLFDLVSKTDKRIYGVSADIRETLRDMNATQKIPAYFQSWIEKVGPVRISNAYAWMDRGTFRYKAYSNLGEEYQRSVENGAYKTLNLERLVAGRSDGELQVGLVECSSLRYNNNRLPLSTFQSPNIKELFIEAECDLTTLSAFTGLEVLHITEQWSWLTALPEDIGELTHLKALYLWHNNLASLPDGIAQLHNLTTINISGNAFTSVPEVLLSLPNLEFVCLRGCYEFEGFYELTEKLHDEGTSLQFVDAYSTI